MALPAFRTGVRGRSDGRRSARPPYSPAVIVAAGLLLLVGLALFVAGLLTGTTALYWGCVAACVVAAGFLVVAWRRIGARSAQRPAAAEPAPGAPSTAAGALPEVSRPPVAAPAAPPAAADREDPPVEEVEVTDLLLIVDLSDEVLVVDEHPRYHVAGCAWVGDRPTIPLPLDEARADGFTPCGACHPDRTLAQRARARRSTAY